MITTDTSIIWEKDGQSCWETKDETLYEFSQCWAVCPNCNGEGTTVNAAFDGMSLSEIDPSDADDFAENLLSGVYDVACAACEGRTTVKACDLSILSPDHLEEYETALFECRRDAAIQEY